MHLSLFIIDVKFFFELLIRQHYQIINYSYIFVFYKYIVCRDKLIIYLNYTPN